MERNATFGASPAKERGADVRRLTPASGSPPPSAASARLSQPSVTPLSPGAAVSMKSCASKCETFAAPADAARVQRVVSPGGVVAWLIESHTLPLVQMSMFFRGGASQDPPDKPGLAYFADWMLDEGVGEMNTAEFYRAKKLLGAAVSKSLTDEREIIGFGFLTEHRDASLDLLRKLLVEPRFDEDAMERARNEILSSLESLRRNPADNIMQKLSEVLYPNHPYGKQRRGTPEAVKSITRADLEAYRRKTFARDNLIISVVGDIDAATLAVQLDRVFGGLPAHAELQPMPPSHSQSAQDVRIVDDVRQTSIAFGYVLDTPFTPEEMPAVQILNHVLSGGILTSRLDREVRVKRGLVYSIGFSIGRTPDSQYGYGTFGAEPSSAEQAFAIAKDEIRKLAEEVRPRRKCATPRPICKAPMSSVSATAPASPANSSTSSASVTRSTPSTPTRPASKP